MKCPDCDTPRARQYGTRPLRRPNSTLRYFRCRNPDCNRKWRARVLFDRWVS